MDKRFKRAPGIISEPLQVIHVIHVILGDNQPVTPAPIFGGSAVLKTRYHGHSF